MRIARSPGGRRGVCLDADRLADYVDHGLSLAERASVEAHLASCRSCTALLAGVARTVAALSTDTPGAERTAATLPRFDWRSAVGPLAAAAAVLAALAVPAWWQPWPRGGPDLVDLAGTVGGEREVLGRLTAGPPHAPLGAPSAGGLDGRAAESERVALIAGKIRESFGDRHTPARLHALGLWQLLDGHVNEATLSLRAAAREQPGHAGYLSDAAAAELERARRGFGSDSLPRALASASRAISANPSLLEAWFNRAAALSAMSLRDQARQAWTEYLARDGASPWAAEARAHLAALAQPTPAERWPGIESRLMQGVDAALAAEAVEAQVSESRRFLETRLLPSWAAAVERGDADDAWREQARHLAAALARATGDTLHQDAVTAIDRAGAGGRDGLLPLARAHRAFAEGVAYFEANRIRESTAALQAARADLRAAGSPFAVRADLELAALAYVARQFADAERQLTAVRSSSAAAAYRFVSGRADRFLGMTAMAQGRLGDAERSYEQMLAGAEEMGDAEQAALAHALLGALFHYLGDVESTWRHQALALPVLSVSPSRAVRYVQLTLTGVALHAADPASALPVRDAVVTAAREWGQPTLLVSALTDRAVTRLALARRLEAEHDVAEARRHLLTLEAPLRGRLEVPLLAVESDLALPRDAEAAAAAAERAIDLLQSSDEVLQLARMNLRLAKAEIAGGQLDAAERALAAGVRAFDATRPSLQDEGTLSTRDELWHLYETAARLAVRRRDYAKAFALSEHARARSLIEAGRMARAPRLADIERRLGPNEAVLAVNQFDTELAVWVIRAAGTSVVVRPVTRTDAERLAFRQRDEIRMGALEPEASAALYDEIVRPVTGHLAGVTRLAVVADEPYAAVSFAALWDKARRRFLVEDVSTRMLPTASAALAGTGKSAPIGSGGTLVLAGAGAAQQASARSIAALHANAALVTDATSSRFFEEAPRRSVVHVAAPLMSSATHPLLSRLVLADDPGRRHSGAVFGREIAARTFANTGLVVLAGPGPDTREAVADPSGLARAFLAAGVPAVVNLLPIVDADAARDLAVGFHRRLGASGSAEDALTTYQRSVLKSNGRRLGAWCALVLYGSDR